MKESLSEQEEVSTRISRRTSKRVQDRHVQRTEEDKHENQMFSLSLVYWFFHHLRSDSQQTTNKARYDAVCVQDMSQF